MFNWHRNGKIYSQPYKLWVSVFGHRIWLEPPTGKDSPTIIYSGKSGGRRMNTERRRNRQGYDGAVGEGSSFD
jgi:hypothetical protein